MNAPLLALHQYAESVAQYYRARLAIETERGLALPALWTLTGVECGRLDPKAAAGIFTVLEVETGEAGDGPELSEDADQLVLACRLLYDWGTGSRG